MAGSDNSHRSLKLEVPSQIQYVDPVHTLAERFAKLAGFDEDTALNIGIAVREAVINGIVHGNGADPKKIVKLRLSSGDNLFEACVQDQGPGYTPDESNDPTSAENLLNTSGRGLLMIRAYVDKVEFVNDEGGLSLRLVKRLETESETSSS
ncbi:MAG: ATP-binding protein [Acidobacteriota bacterium]|nr:ATP-binding protein [Acidobacteriota bacterium]MDH3784285.1 ATP-binding protein [Acidobacteriota bacterium]